MIEKTITEFFDSYESLRMDLKNFSIKKESLSDETIEKLSRLVFLNICTLGAFKVLLESRPEEALKVIKERFLSVDLSNHVKNQVRYLDVMFSDIREILGDEEFNNLLNCPEFLPKNKRNKRVKEAIEFALDED